MICWRCRTIEQRMPGRPLKLGIQLPEVERLVPWPELAAMATRIEAIGLDSIWVGDHLLYRFPDGSVRGPWECWTTLAALAAVTQRVELAPFVASTAFHSPAMLAKKAATVEEISGGRLILALGAGWNRTEFEAFGFPFDHRASRFEEAFTIIRTLLREGRIDFEGRYYRLKDCALEPKGPRPGGPPLLIGSVGPRMLEIALPHVDGWNAWFDYFDNDPAVFGHLVRRVEEACRKVGRDPFEVWATAALLLQFADRPLRPNSRHAITGGPSKMADAILRLHQAGASHIQLVLDPITLESIDRLFSVADRVTAAGVR
jgi:alkanesulfonate monooxygenase SsuD/methylene tetrahydromethanopterin reductase-like flavin-dependent oxidoreductase (luciferase family)